MSDTGIVVKGLVLLFVVAMFVTLIAQQPPPGVTPPPPNTSLTTVQTTFTEGMPRFQDPFSPQTFSQTVPVSSAKPCPAWSTPSGVCEDSITDFADGTHGCDPWSWWLCATSDDNGTSYFQVNAAGMPATDVNFSTPASGAHNYNVVSLTLTVVCRSTSGSIPSVEVDMSVDPTMILVSTPFHGIICAPNPTGTATFTNSTIDMCQQHQEWCGFYAGPGSGLDLDRVTARFRALAGAFQITYAHIDYVYYIAPTDCSTVSGGFFGWDQFVCYVNQAVTWAIKAGQWLLNGIVFVGQLAVWGGTMLYVTGSAFVGSLLWVSNMPGTPPFITGLLVAVIVMPLIVGLTLVFIHIIRGNPSGV